MPTCNSVTDQLFVVYYMEELVGGCRVI